MKTQILFKRFIKGDPLQVKEFCFYINGHKYWYLNNDLHRMYEPAVIYHNGEKRWWLEGSHYSEKEYWKTLKKYKNK